MSALVEELLAKQAIQEKLYSYCRGLDRMDKAMARAVWHDEGTAHYQGMYEGTGHGFVEWVWGAHEGLERHSHQLSNSLFIVVDGTNAKSEAYITIALWTNPDANGSQKELVNRGRYLDQWSNRAGVWAIDHREYILDMHTVHELHRGDVSETSARDISDPSFGFFC